MKKLIFAAMLALTSAGAWAISAEEAKTQLSGIQGETFQAALANLLEGAASQQDQANILLGAIAANPTEFNLIIQQAQASGVAPGVVGAAVSSAARSGLMNPARGTGPQRTGAQGPGAGAGGGGGGTDLDAELDAALYGAV